MKMILFPFFLCIFHTEWTVTVIIYNFVGIYYYLFFYCSVRKNRNRICLTILSFHMLYATAPVDKHVFRIKKKIENENWEKQFLLVDTISFLFRRSSFGTNFSSKNVLNWLESSWITMSININQKKKLLHSWFSFVLDESHWAIELH